MHMAPGIAVRRAGIDHEERTADAAGGQAVALLPLQIGDERAAIPFVVQAVVGCPQPEAWACTVRLADPQGNGIAGHAATIGGNQRKSWIGGDHEAGEFAIVFRQDATQPGLEESVEIDHLLNSTMMLIHKQTSLPYNK